jgi:hypothetical protein
MKSVQNWISYLHKISRIFSPFLFIFPALEISFKFIFKSIKLSPVGPTCLRQCRRVPHSDWSSWVALSCGCLVRYKTPASRSTLSERSPVRTPPHCARLITPPATIHFPLRFSCRSPSSALEPVAAALQNRC